MAPILIISIDIFSYDFMYDNVNKQVHSLCEDSRPGDWLRLAKGPPSIIPPSITHSINVKLT